MPKPILIFAAGLLTFARISHADSPVWSDFAGNAQHTADSAVASDSLSSIRWSTPVDLDPQYAGNGDLYIHYGSPLITANNTVIVPVKTGAYGGFQIDAINGSSGVTQWTQASDYILPAHDWTPEFAPAITPTNTLYYPGAGGTVYAIANADSATPGSPTQIAFFGNSNYAADSTAYNSDVFIDTPITSDSSGDIYFGYRVTGINPPLGLTSGIARITPTGSATYEPISSLAAGVTTTVMNGAPAITSDGTRLYIAVSNGSAGDLLELNAANLQPLASVALNDPATAQPALLDDDGTASVTIGPDGQVYYGVLENPLGTHNYRGWLLQFSSDLSQEKTPGSFGWDDTASVVPASMVPSYHGSSTYLLMTKYNNYAGAGSGNGENEIAILDPNATMTDPISGKLGHERRRIHPRPHARSERHQ